MKQLFNGENRHNRNSIALTHGSNRKIAGVSILLICLAFGSCQKEATTDQAQQLQPTGIPKSQEANTLNFYTGLDDLTMWQLQQARAATAKYRNIDNAIKDGYADIAVDVQHMGHHYMNTSLVDSVFDIRQPEILVYNKDQNGNQQLVAVEYAVPLTYPQPAGFAGTNDVWNGTSGFPLWLLHAWVWAYNPDGVFNWTNSTVDLH